MKPNPEQIASFVTDLRNAIIILGESLPDAESYLVKYVGERYARWAEAYRLKGCPLMDEYMAIATLLQPGSPSWPTERERSAMSRGRTFVDDWPLPDDASITRQLHQVDWCFRNLNGPPPMPADGQILDRAALAAVALYQAWRPSFDQAHQAQQSAFQVAREATAPPHRQLPHRPDPQSLIMARDHASGAIKLAANSNYSPRSAAEVAALASSHLIHGLVGHWLYLDRGAVRADLDRAADLMASVLPDIPLHAWQYEQWQHVAIAIGHTKLANALWALRRQEWDHDRIRPVNWLICRIRILDLFHHGGREDELRELMEKCRLGLFAEQLPSELQPDFPLMRNWYHLLHAIVHRDQPKFDERLLERQGLLAEHWKRGGGIAAISLLDLGGLALLRTARLRGLKTAAFDSAYLPRELQAT